MDTTAPAGKVISVPVKAECAVLEAFMAGLDRHVRLDANGQWWIDIMLGSYQEARGHSLNAPPMPVDGRAPSGACPSGGHCLKGTAECPCEGAGVSRTQPIGTEGDTDG